MYLWEMGTHDSVPVGNDYSRVQVQTSKNPVYLWVIGYFELLRTEFFQDQIEHSGDPKESYLGYLAYLPIPICCALPLRHPQ